jgi:hypothetical protein
MERVEYLRRRCCIPQRIEECVVPAGLDHDAVVDVMDNVADAHLERAGTSELLVELLSTDRLREGL